MKNSTDKQTHLFDRPEVVKWTLRIFYSSCIFLVLIDFLIHRHVETSVEKVPAFYAIYGLIACIVFVLLAKQLRKLLMRGKDYYESPMSTDEPGSNNTLLSNSLDKRQNTSHNNGNER